LDVYAKRIEFDKRNPKGPEQMVLKNGMCSCYGKLAEKRFRGLNPETNEPIIPPHACPWFAAVITAHTRRELMKAALIAPNCVIAFATDAIYSEVLLDLPRLKADADIKAGKEDKYSVIGAGRRSPPCSFNRGWRSISTKTARSRK
jgi:hypothetical protein